MAEAQKADDGDDEQTGFDEEFAAVEPIYGDIFQAGIGEQAMPEKSGGSEINGEVERLPKMAAEAKAHIGSDNDEGEHIESDRADGVVERLLGRMHRVNDVHDAKARIFVEEQSHRMKDGDAQREVSRPIVNPEIIKPVMRPGAVRAVAEGHEHSQKHV